VTRNIEEKIVFAIAPSGQGDGVPLLLVGVPTGAWDYMKDGKTHHFDLSSIGIPFKLMMYGASDHGAAMKVIEEAAKQQNVPLLDERRRDWAIKPKGLA
jgi:hypothetical protein